MRSLFLLSVVFLVLVGLVRGADNIAEGEQCQNGDTCVEGVGCFANVCRQLSEFPETSNGFGNACSETDCCNTDLVCNAQVLKCVPNFEGLEQVVCNGNGTVPPPTTDGEAPYVPDIAAVDGINLGPGVDAGANGQINVTGSCTNRDICSGGFRCLANQCVAFVEGSEIVVPGTGNTCSASDCCRVGLECNSETNACIPITSTLNYVNCTADSTVVPPVDSSSTGPDIVGDNGASSQHASYVFMFLACASTLVLAAW